ncbi:pyroglutamyl-peptidase I [Tahibacter amnicola]|uniref:Pyrrolidone-carboxylate peptidase n=1 Tax=Tahibacter amnicola TaxID=2976241 RepID=A0ABY6BP55_9GAMM|nr:pyroglutamyl-peptidase I [Tahibacter amnicola]UXI69552.1 pyroglutamyl-peptidase I [Tahibacter amnicola]
MSRRAATARKVLLTGFDPFGGETINPSWEAVRGLDGEDIAGHRIVATCLPTEFGRSRRALRAAIARAEPGIVLCVGQAGGRAALSIERVAINVDDARIPDNAGRQPVDRPIIADAPAAYFATLPIKSMLTALQGAGVPAEISQTAGTFVCNHVFFALMHALASRRTCRGGFVHIPYLPEQAARHPGAPGLALETVQRGLRILIETAATTRRDRRIAAGATH